MAYFYFSGNLRNSRYICAKEVSLISKILGYRSAAWIPMYNLWLTPECLKEMWKKTHSLMFPKCNSLWYGKNHMICCLSASFMITAYVSQLPGCTGTIGPAHGHVIKYDSSQSASTYIIVNSTLDCWLTLRGIPTTSGRSLRHQHEANTVVLNQSCF